MKFLSYLKDQWSIILGWLFVGLTIFVVWLAPNIIIDWGTVGYLALIQGVFLIFLFICQLFE